jgi:hypothetical protein
LEPKRKTLLTSESQGRDRLQSAEHDKDSLRCLAASLSRG